MTFQYCFDGSIKKVNNLSVSSPRTWGCFHGLPYITSVAASLPHARGGVSRQIEDLRHDARSSPRTWGCFHRSMFGSRYEDVFPTHVGVFLTNLHFYPLLVCLPHARGGVSPYVALSSACAESSPRTWGCFQRPLHTPAQAFVFPTHVGVFLMYRMRVSI